MQLSAANAAVQATPVLRIQDVSKSFGPVAALKHVTLDIYGGRVHTLLGENGAGKSTLIKIIGGLYPASAGTMLLAGEPYRPRTPMDAGNAGISIIFQELSLSRNLTIAENIFAAREPAHFGFINNRRLYDEAAGLLQRLGFALDPRTPVGRLSLAQRQLVEIAKGLSRNARLVVMDEPTSSLGDSEVELLFTIIERLRAAGVAVIYISHRMDELMRVSDVITVLRDGEYVSSSRREETNINELITRMVGRPLNNVYPPRTVPAPPAETKPILQVSGLSAPGVFEDVSFDVRPGEIVGFFGLVGAGRSDVMKALFGRQPVAAGQIRIDGQPVSLRHPNDAIKRGIAFVTENRKEEGLVLRHSVERNIAAVRYAGLAPALSLARPRAERQTASEEVERLQIKTPSLLTLASALSGGNQQKVVLGKWLAVRPHILILDEPTRGIDVGAKFEIYRIIRELAAQGTAILLVSSELPEILGLSDRVVVMHEKQIVTTLPRQGLTQEIVMMHAAGAQGHAGEVTP